MKLIPKPKSQRERDIQASILNVLRRLPWIHVERNNSGKMPNPTGRYVTYGLGTGSADLICVVGPRQAGGRMLALEVKQPGKKATEEQLLWLNSMRQLGARAEVVTSVDQACEYAFDVYSDGVDLAIKAGLFTPDATAFIEEAREQLEAAKRDAAQVQTKREARRSRKLVIKSPTAVV